MVIEKPKIDTVDRKHPLALCEECPLFDAACAPTTGPQDAKIAVVSRSPGYHEAQAGRPFSGPSGKILDHLLQENGVERKDVLLTNVVLCYTDTPSKEAIAACRPRLLSETAEASLLLLCGSESTKEFVGKSVSTGRGSIHDIDGDRRAVVTFNPAVALRDDGRFLDLQRDFRRALQPRPNPIYPTVRWTEDVREACDWLDTIRASNVTTFAADIETTGLEYDSALVSIGIGTADKAVVIGRTPLQHSAVRTRLGQLLSDPTKRVIWHNGKFDCKVLRANGVPARVHEDTLLLSYSLDERPRSHDLDFLVQDRLGWDDYTPEYVRSGKKCGQWIGREDELLKKYGLTWEQYAEALYEYNGKDVAGTFQLFDLLVPEAEADDCTTAYRNLLVPASEVYTEIEKYGIKFDSDLAVKILKTEVLPELDYLKSEANRIVGRDINMNSAPQLEKLYYDELGLRHTLDRRGKERSVDSAIRNEILEGRATFLGSHGEQQSFFDAIGHSFTANLHRFKRLDKIRSTYLEGLIEHSLKDGRIHGTFNLHGTETGRRSGSNPNLQNQPRPQPGEKLPNIRSLFTASPGRVLMQADYSQAELRVAAVLSGDAALQQIYKDGIDLHSETAEEFYGPKFTKEQRVNAKTINFRILYGGEAFGFSQQLAITEREAQKYINYFWNRFPQLHTWVKLTQKRTLRDGELVSPFGRKRRFHIVTPENRLHTLKEAVNFMIQSPAGDLTLWSLIHLWEVMDRKRAMPVIEGHDSLVFDVEKGYAKEFAQLCKRVMESASSLALDWRLPFTVDIETGYRWGDLSE